MVHRIVQFALASLLTTTLAAGAAWAQDEPAGGEEPAGDDAAGEGGDEAGGEAGGEAAGGMEEGGGGEMAPAEAPKKIRFGVAGVLAIPISPSEFTDFTGIGIGALVGVLYGMNEKLALAGHAGLIYHLPKEDVTLMEIPILAGVRYMVIPKLALGVDTGINIMRTSIDVEGAESQTNTRIPLAISAGYMIGGNLMVSGVLWIPNLLLRDEGEDMAMEIGGVVGYLF